MPISNNYAAALAIFGGAKNRIDPNNVEAAIKRVAARGAPSGVRNASGHRLTSNARAVAASLPQAFCFEGVGSQRQPGAYKPASACNTRASAPKYNPEVRAHIAKFEVIIARLATVPGVAQRRPINLQAIAQAFVASAPVDERDVLSPISPVERGNFFSPLMSPSMVRAVSLNMAVAPAIESPSKTIESEKAGVSLSGVYSPETKAGREIFNFLGFNASSPPAGAISPIV